MRIKIKIIVPKRDPLIALIKLKAENNIEKSMSLASNGFKYPLSVKVCKRSAIFIRYLSLLLNSF